MFILAAYDQASGSRRAELFAIGLMTTEVVADQVDIVAAFSSLGCGGC